MQRQTSHTRATEGQTYGRTPADREAERWLTVSIHSNVLPTAAVHAATDRQPVTAPRRRAVVYRIQKADAAWVGLWAIALTGCVPPCYTAVNKTDPTFHPAVVTFT